MMRILFYLSALVTSCAFGQTNCNEPQQIGQTGCITFDYAGQTVTYTIVKAADGNIWLQQNLGATAVAQSASDANAFGDQFQWGRHADGHQKTTSATTTSVPSPNNPLGFSSDEFIIGSPGWWSNPLTTDTWNAATPSAATETNGCDPCKALGNGWHVPTQAEWSSIVAQENITNIASAFQSNLKLPVAGSRKETGSFAFVGQRGYYWSATPSTNATFTKYLYYSDFIVNPDAGAVRGQGSSVRCLRAALAPSTPEYCEVGVEWDVEPISRVVFANIDNQTSADVNTTPAYEDFIAMTANVVIGQSYGISVEGNTVGGFSHDIRVFIDWNHDGVFDMDSEYYPYSITDSNGTDGIAATGTIEIPANATVGTTRMRITKDMWNVYEPGEFDACTYAYYGQIEEYSVNVQPSLSNPDLSKNKFSVYPNPSKNRIFVQSEANVEALTFTTLQGRIVGEYQSNEADISGFTSGVYIIKIKFTDGQTAIAKVVKE